MSGGTERSQLRCSFLFSSVYSTGTSSRILIKCSYQRPQARRSLALYPNVDQRKRRAVSIWIDGDNVLLRFRAGFKQPYKEPNEDSGAARLGLWGGAFGLKVAAMKMESSDAPIKVADFYRKELVTPIVIPRTVRNERSGFRTTTSSAMVSDSLNPPEERILSTTSSSPAYLYVGMGYFVSPFPSCSGMLISILIAFITDRISSARA
jgi:hypothetical protein